MVRSQIAEQERRVRLCALVTMVALASACSDAPRTNDVNEEIFGGTPPSDAELATFPKVLPAEAFATGGGLGAVALSSFVIPESALPPVQAQGTSSNFGYPGSCEVWSAGYAMGS